MVTAILPDFLLRNFNKWDFLRAQFNNFLHNDRQVSVNKNYSFESFFTDQNDPGQLNPIFSSFAFQNTQPFYRICALHRPMPARLRGVAQPGRALPSGGRGRKFESSHPDQFRAWNTRTYKACPVGLFSYGQHASHLQVTVLYGS